MTPFERRLSEFPARFRRERLSSDVLAEARRRVLDTLGCFYGAFNAKPGRIVRSTIAAPTTGEATLWGTRRRAAADLAAWANGTCVRTLDYNDTYLSLEPCHPSDLIASLWAACEIDGRLGQGRRLLHAIVLAYETLCRLCDAASLRTRGWDHVTYLPIASAVGCSYIFRLNPEKTRHAIALAMTGSVAMRQTRVGEISDWKAACAAYAARSGLLGARMAAQGFTGPFEIFTGRHGFFAQVSGRFSMTGRPLEAPWKILSTHVKFFPAEHHAQSAIEAALELRNRLGGDVGKIRSVAIECFEVATSIIGSEPEKWKPTTRETADHSMPYLVAAALIDGSVTLQQYERRRFMDADIRALMKKTEVTALPRYSRRYPVEMPTRVVVRTSDGRVDSVEVGKPKGYAGRPLSEMELCEKFNRLASPVLGAPRTARLSDAVMRIGRLDRLSALAPLLEVR
jgi:2-methylcitrate dehydratase